MNQCQAKLEDTFLHSGDCPYSDFIGGEHDGKYFCIFHLPYEFKNTDNVGKRETINKNFLNKVNELISVANLQNKELSKEIKIPLDIRGVIFSIEMDFQLISKIIYTSIDFTGSKFYSSTKFDECIIHGMAIFKNVEFNDVVSFNQTSIHGGGAGTDFSNTKFKNNVNFHKADLRGQTKFIDAIFEDDVNILNSDIYDSKFINTIFFKNIKFNDTRFQAGSIFQNTKFGFSRQKKSNFQFNFQIAQFLEDTKFLNCKFYGATKFDGTKFYKNVEIFNSHFTIAPSIINLDVNNENISFNKTTFDKGEISTFRKFKKMMEEQRNMWEATIFYGKELFEEWRESKFIWKIFSLNTFYLCSNNYGRWWLLPILWIILLTVGFAGLYYYYDLFILNNTEKLIGWEKGIHDYSKFKQSIIFSAQNLKLSWLFGRQIMYPTNGWSWLLNGFQSVINIILFAMTIISIRKRFKI